MTQAIRIEMPSDDEYISEFISIQTKYLDSLVNIVYARPELEEDVKELISYIVDSGDGIGFRFDDFVETILKCNGNESILVQGAQGTGKSTFLSFLWYELLKRYAKSESSLLPCYVDLHYYDYLNEHDAQVMLEDDLKRIHASLKAMGLDRVFFILDGIDTYRRELPKLQKVLFNHVSDYPFRTICLGSAEDIPVSYDQKNESVWLGFSYYRKLEVKSIHRDQKALLHRIVDIVAKIYAKTQEASSECIVVTAQRYSVRKVDFRTILLLIRIVDQGITLDPRSLGIAINKYYNMLGINDELRLEAQYATQYQLGMEPDRKDTKPKILRHKNRLMRDYLTAYDFHMAICESGQSRNMQTRIAPYCQLRQTFSVSTNRFIKDFYHDLKPKEGRQYVNCLISMLLSATTSVQMKAQITYMLGRVEEYSESQARKILVKQYNALYGTLFTSRYMLRTDSIAKTAELVLFRTTAVSLLNLEYKDHIKGYLKCVLYNARMMEINRAFHQKYYNEPTEQLDDYDYIDDVLSDFSVTQHILSKKIRKVIQSGSQQYSAYLDIITLYSFAISRIRTLSQNTRNELALLAREILAAPNTKNPTISLFKLPIVRSYVQLALDILSRGELFVFDIVTELYSLKIKKRQGWVERKVNMPESISDHMYYCFLIALLFLPPTLDAYDDEEENSYLRHYHKEKVLSMLLVHDIGEALNGDIIHGRKSETDTRVEVERVRYYGLLSAIPFFFGLASYSDLHDQYEKQADINARVAKDIDILEAYLQACYYSVNNSGVDVCEWGSYANANLKTAVGRSIKNTLDQNIASKMQGGKLTMYNDGDRKPLANDTVIWVQLSDLHYDLNRAYTNTQAMLLSLKKQLNDLVHQAFGQQNATIALICTGDYRFAKDQREATALSDAKAVSVYINELAELLGVAKEHIIILPGNHDVNRNHRYIREAVVKELYCNYLDHIKENGIFPHQEQYAELMEGFAFFQMILKNIYGEILGEAKWQQWCRQGCIVEIICGLQFVLINTAIVSSDYKPEDQMVYGWGYPHAIRESLDPNLPVIVLGHHGYDFLHMAEREQFISFLRNSDVLSKIYLCGHAHEIDVKDIGFGITQFTAGTLRQDDKISQAGFYIGKYEPHNKQVEVKAVFWDKHDKAWRIDRNFNKGDGAKSIQVMD